MSRKPILGLTVAIGLAWGTSALAQHEPLYTWYSESRGDHFTTSHPSWIGSVGDELAPGYRLLRVEGAVLSPDFPQPPDTVPLYNFWNGERQDNFLTSDRSWTEVENKDGYARSRLEGYIYMEPKAGTVPLVSLWSGAARDNYSTTDPRLAFATGAAGNATDSVSGRDYDIYRVAGYLLPPPWSADIGQRAHKAHLGSIGFGAWRPLRPEDHGTRPEDPIQRLAAPFKGNMLVVPLEYSDVRFGLSDLHRLSKLASATDDLSLERGFTALSRGNFSWRGELTPVVRDRITLAEALRLGDAFKAFHRELDGDDVVWTPERFERTYGHGLSVYDLDGDGIENDEVGVRMRLLKLVDASVRYDIYDANGDGRVDRSELVVLQFGAGEGLPGGQFSWAGDYEADGKTVGIKVGLLSKNTTRAGIMHELLHNWGGTELYGPGFLLNRRNSIMAGMEGDDTVWELDPWYQQRLGWVRPRFVSIGGPSRRSGGSEVMLAAGHDRSGQERARPIIFYDPGRSLEEYFVAQYRTPFPKCSTGILGYACPDYQDNGAPDIGFAVWHVITDSDGFLDVILKSDDTGNRIAWPAGTGGGGAMVGLGVIDPTDGKIGRSRYLKPADGELALSWWDGEDTGLRLRAGLVSNTSNVAVLQWRGSTTPFTPRLDVFRVEGFPSEEYPAVNAGQLIAVDGVFGADGGGFGARLIAEGGDERTARVTSWSPTRALIELPSDAPEGRYELVVSSGGSTSSSTTLSNGMRLRIRPTVIARLDLPPDALRGVGLGAAWAARLEDVEGACAEAVQGKIAWDYSGSKRWGAQNVAHLCQGAESSDQPARCFEQVMHGGVDWGGGTRWNWKNALNLCKGSLEANVTVSCFESAITDGLPWSEAIETCT
jgi:hypothetical protein